MHNRDLILRIVIVALLVYSLTAFGSGVKELGRRETEILNLERELEDLRYENKALKAELDSGPDNEKTGELAREKLGMIGPDDKIFIFSKDREELLWSWK